MKKKFTNGDIVTMFNVLNNLKGRTDIVVGNADIFWANCLNLDTLKEKVDKFQKVVNSITESYFTDEVTHTEKNVSGEEDKVLNDDVKEEVLNKLQKEINSLTTKEVSVDIETIPKEAIKDMIKANEKSMTYLEMTVMRQFVEEE